MAYLMHMMGYGQTEEEKNKENSSEEVVEAPFKKEGIEHPLEKKEENYKGYVLGEKLPSTRLEESAPIEGEEEERERKNIPPQEWCKKGDIKSSEKEGEGKMSEEGEHQDSSTIGGYGKVKEELAKSKSPSYGSNSSEHTRSPENDEFEAIKVDEFFKEPTKGGNELPKEPTEVDVFSQEFTNEFPKESIKVDECPNEPKKLEDFPKEPSNLEDFPKEPKEVDYFLKEPTKVDDFSKEPKKVDDYQDCLKEPTKVDDFPKEPIKVHDFSKEPAKVDDYQDFPKEPTKVDDLQDFPKQPTKVDDFPKESIKVDDFQDFPREPTKVDNCPKEPTKVQECHKEEPIEVEEDQINKEEHKATLKEKLMIKVKGDADHDSLKVKFMSKVFGKSPEGNKNKDELGGA